MQVQISYFKSVSKQLVLDDESYINYNVNSDYKASSKPYIINAYNFNNFKQQAEIYMDNIFKKEKCKLTFVVMFDFDNPAYLGWYKKLLKDDDFLNKYN